MLANLLPGFRHTRTPLVAGILWLLVLWLAVGPDLVPDPAGGFVEQRLAQLLDLLGRPVLLGAGSLIAVLVGGLIPPVPVAAIVHRLPINMGGRKPQAICFVAGATRGRQSVEGDLTHWLWILASFAPEDLEWEEFKRTSCPPSIRTCARDLEESGGARLGRQVIDEREWGAITAEGVDDPDVRLPLDPESRISPWALLRGDIAEAAVEIECMNELPTRLRSANPELFSEFDRLRAESDLRASIVVPLALLVSFLCFDSVWWIAAMVVPLWLLRQAVQAFIDSKHSLLGAVRAGAVESPTVAFVRELAELPRRRENRPMVSEES